MFEVVSDCTVCRQRLLERLQEPAPRRIQLLTGPRQVGKTTLLPEIAAPFEEALHTIRKAGPESTKEPS
jgi:predicted AAA+ superfamily ATPase